MIIGLDIYCFRSKMILYKYIFLKKFRLEGKRETKFNA